MGAFSELSRTGTKTWRDHELGRSGCVWMREDSDEDSDWLLECVRFCSKMRWTEDERTIDEEVGAGK